MGRGKPFVQSVNRLISAGVIPRPAWQRTLESTRPVFEAIQVTKPPKIAYPEDRLRSTFLERNPDARRIPVNLKAKTIPERHVADKFVAMQTKFMQENGMPEEEAYNAADRVLNVETAQVGENGDLYGPLVNQAVQDETARLYLASLKDSQRDQKQLRGLLKQSKQSS